MRETGHWFAPYLNGEFYDHKPPLYFWLVGGLTALMGSHGEYALYVIAWLLSLACLIAAFFLIRALLPEPTAWLAAVVMASSFLYTVTTGIARMDLMMLAFMLLGLLAFVRGYTTGRRPLYVWFFVFCALAVMTKGPYGLVLPLVGVLVFLAWERRLKEAVSPWFLGGFLIGLGVVGLWLCALVLVEGRHILRDYIVHQTFGRVAGSWAHPEPFWYYVALLPIEFLPWIAFVPRGFALMRRRRPVAFRLLLALAASNLVVLSAVSCKIFVYILSIWPALAAAAAFALHEAAPQPSSRPLRIETAITGALLVALGLAAHLLCRYHFPEKTASMIPLAVALVVLGVLVIVLAAIPAVRRHTVIVASVLIVAGLAFSRLTALVLTPAFNDVMSPAAPGEAMRDYADRDYVLATCGIPFGTYNYYARTRVIKDIKNGTDLPAFLQKNPRAVVAIRETTLEEIRHALPEVLITDKHLLELKPHHLLVQPK